MATSLLSCSYDDGCRQCGKPLPRTKAGKVAKNRIYCSPSCRTEFVSNHLWSWARTAALRRDKFACIVCGAEQRKGVRLEVNHIEPVNGRRKSFDCQNHINNLETLCHECHVAVTKQQRGLGLITHKRRHRWQIEYLGRGVSHHVCTNCALSVRSKSDRIRHRGEECPGVR